jgi:hypothetical protein
MKSLYYALFASVFLISGCKKDEPKKEVDLEKFMYFNNINPYAIRADFYTSLEDYGNQENIFKTYVIPANTVQEIPRGTFDEDASYYVDYYSDDFIYNNWRYEDVMYFPNSGSGYLEFDMPPNNSARLIFLENTKNQTKWKAVDAFDPGDSTLSIWGQLSPMEKNVKITFNRNFYGKLTVENNTGVIESEVGLGIYYSYNAPPFINLVDLTYFKPGVSSGAPSFAMIETRSSPDTIICRLRVNFAHDYIMVKEN